MWIRCTIISFRISETVMNKSVYHALSLLIIKAYCFPLRRLRGYPFCFYSLNKYTMFRVCTFLVYKMKINRNTFFFFGEYYFFRTEKKYSNNIVLHTLCCIFRIFFFSFNILNSCLRVIAHVPKMHTVTFLNA